MTSTGVDGRPVAVVCGRPRLRSTFDVFKQLIVLKQPIELGQLGFEAQLQRGYQREQVDRRHSIS
jgi:hypothetical protein